VTFRDVRVGAVDGIVIQYEAQTHTAYIPVTLQLEPDRVRVSGDANVGAGLDLGSLIARGLRAELNTQSFVTGQSEIELDFRPGSAGVLHPAITSLTEIPTRQSTIQRVTEQLSQLPLRELVTNANATLESVRGLSETLSADLPPLVASVTAASDGASHTVEIVTQAISDFQSRLDATLGSISQLATNSDQQLDQRGADLHALLASTNQAVLQVHEVVNDLKTLTSNRGNARKHRGNSARPGCCCRVTAC
jgi:paraquat-inducible protein B